MIGSGKSAPSESIARAVGGTLEQISIDGGIEYE
jgi:hypothetical protein